MRIVHSADMHLGWKQYGFADREADFMDAARRVFETARRVKADLVTLGGDQFENALPPASAVHGLQRMVAESNSHGIPVYGIDGNHDATSTHWLNVCGIKPLEAWEDDAQTVPRIQTWKTQTTHINVFGINSAPPSLFRKKLTAVTESCKERGINLDVLLAHMPLADLWGLNIADVTAEEISQAVQSIGTRLVLLGDIHDYKESVINDIRFIYPGSPEVTASDEQPAKSCSVINIDNTEITTALEDIPTRPLMNIEINSEEELDTLVTRVHQAASEDGRTPVVTVAYDPSIKGFAKRAGALLQDRALYRLVPHKAVASANLVQQLGDSKFERSGALRNLHTVVTDTFAAGSDACDLIIKLLNSPDKVESIIVQYAQDKGLDAIK